MNKDSFVLYNSFYEPIKALNDAQLGKLFRAIFEYTTSGEITQDNEILIAFMFIKNQIDLDTKKWQDIKKKRRFYTSSISIPYLYVNIFFLIL